MCALERGEVYPKSLPKYCKPRIDQAQAGVHHGCYQDSFKQRLFSGSVTKFRDSNSADQCISHCVDNGYQYSGLQYGVECFCGNNKPDDKHKVRGSWVEKLQKYHVKIPADREILLVT